MKKSRILFVIILMVSVCMSTTAQEKKNDAVKKMTTSEFKKQIWNYSSDKDWKYMGDKPAIIDLYADWCPPCRKLSPILADVARENIGKINVYKVNIDNEPELAQLFNASSIPLMVFIPMGDKPTLVKGLRPKEDIDKLVKSIHLKNNSSSSTKL